MAVFENLPPELVLITAQKLPPPDFVKLLRSRKTIKELCFSKNNLLLLPEVTVTVLANGLGIRYRGNLGVPIREEIDLSLFRLKGIINVQTFFTTELMKQLISLVEATDFRCDLLKVFRLNCDPENIKVLIGLTNPAELEISDSLSKDFYSPGLFQNVTRIQVSSTDYGDEELLQLTAKDIRFQRSSAVTCVGVNGLLKEWCNGNRLIKFVQFKMRETDEEVLLEGMNSSLLYEAFSHEDSIISTVDDDELPSCIHDNTFYVLIRPSNLNEMMIVVVGETTVTVERADDPAWYLLQKLNARNYYEVTGRIKSL